MNTKVYLYKVVYTENIVSKSIERGWPYVN